MSGRHPAAGGRGAAVPGSGPAVAAGGVSVRGVEPEDRGARRRIPDLAVLPPLLHGTPPFLALSGALGPGGSAPGPGAVMRP